MAISLVGPERGDYDRANERRCLFHASSAYDLDGRDHNLLYLDRRDHPYQYPFFLYNFIPEHHLNHIVTL